VTEQHFILRDGHVRDRAMLAINTMPLKPTLMEVVIRPCEKTRTLGQNARYWATLSEHLRQINATVNQIASDSGHTPLEIKRGLAGQLAPEEIAILFATRPEVAHEVLKMVCNIPTSTRLGTKKSIEFEERVTAAMDGILALARGLT